MSDTPQDPPETTEDQNGASANVGRRVSHEAALSAQQPTARDTRLNAPQTPQQPLSQPTVTNAQHEAPNLQTVPENISPGRGRSSRLISIIQAVWDRARKKQTEIRWAVTAVSLGIGIIGVFELLPSTRAANDGARAAAFAAWDARKNYMEYCESVRPAPHPLFPTKLPHQN